MSQTAHDPALDHREFVSEEVRVHVHKKPACRIEMTVKTNAQLVKEARKLATKAVGKEVILPGFRKGKAPEEMILKKFPGDIEKQMHKTIADLSFTAAQKLAKIPLLNNNSAISFDLKNHSAEGAEVVFSFETEPHIPSIDVKGFSPQPIQKAEVSDQQIEEAVRQMRFFYAQWNPIFDRPIQEGDYIMIDLDTLEGETVQKVFHHIRFEVSKERMANWMKKLVEGAKAGDILEGTSEPDESATPEEKTEFSPKKVRLTILKVEEAVLPEVNDEFAKKVGASDVAHMRKSIFELLNKQAEDKVNSELREQVNRFLIEHYSFELPQSLIDTEKKHRLQQMFNDPSFKREWQKMSQEERQALDEKLTEESSQAVKLFYLSRQLVRDQQIPITHKEVQDEAVSLYQSQGHTQNLDQMPQEIYALALSKVILAKAQDYAIKHQNA